MEKQFEMSSQNKADLALFEKVNHVEAISDLLMALQEWRDPMPVGNGNHVTYLSKTNTGYPWEAELLADLEAVREKHRVKLMERLRHLVK